MEKASYKQYIRVISLLIFSMILLSLVPVTPKLDSATIDASLPETIGEYKAESILFCENMECLRSMPESRALNKLCRHCSSTTDLISPVEKRMLPEDTIIIRKFYSTPEGKSVTASIVVSGEERTSIHRPQMCLVGQGYNIIRQYTQSFELKDNTNLKATILDLESPASRNLKHTFIYWFASSEHRTPYHIERMILTAKDNILKGNSPRWMYLSLLFEESSINENDLTQFVISLEMNMHSMQ